MSVIEEKKNEPPDKIIDDYKSIKVPLKIILKHSKINRPKILSAVNRCHKIVVNVLMFMKLYLLSHFEKHNKLPFIDTVFVNSCMKILCKSSTQVNTHHKKLKI